MKPETGPESGQPESPSESGSEFTPDIARWVRHVTSQGVRLDRIVELVYKNGGTIEFCGEYGIHEGGGPYGRTGLTQEEAFELIFLNGFIQGCSYWEGSDAPATALVKLVEERLNEVLREPRKPKIYLPGES